MRRKNACPHYVNVKMPLSLPPPPATWRGFRCWCFECEHSFVWHRGSGKYIQPGESIFPPAVAWSVISQRTLRHAPWQATEGCVMDALLSSRKSYAAPVCFARRKKLTKKSVGVGRKKKKEKKKDLRLRLRRVSSKQ